MASTKKIHPHKQKTEKIFVKTWTILYIHLALGFFSFYRESDYSIIKADVFNRPRQCALGKILEIIIPVN